MAIPTSSYIFMKCFYACIYWATVVVEVESPGTVFTGSSEVNLTCEIYGYPRDSSSPVWTRGSDELQGDRYTTTVNDDDLQHIAIQY